MVCRILILVLILTEFVFSASWIGGFYEAQFGFLKEGDYRFAGWRKHYLNMKLWASPKGGVETYMEAHAWTDDWNKRKKLYFNTGFIKLWQKPFDVRFLYKYQQFYLYSPLLYVVDQYEFQDTSSSMGFRIDAGKSFNFIFSVPFSNEFFSQGIRFSRRIYFQDNLFQFGLNQLYTNRDNSKNSVYSFDFSFLKGRFSFIVEGAGSIDKNDNWNKRGKAFEIEARDLKIFNFYLTGKYYNYGENFISRVSNKFYYPSGMIGRIGRGGEIKYLFPRKAIDLIYRFDNYKTRYNEDVNDLDTFYDEYRSYYWRWIGIRVYFVKGIDTTFAFDSWRDRDGEEKGTFFEMKAENRFSYIKFQFRIKDLEDLTELGKRYVFAEEIRVKLLKNLNFYIRNVEVIGKKRSWVSGFYQIHYNIGWDFDIYVEFGQSNHTQDLVYSEEVVDNKFSYDGSTHPYDGVREMFRVMFQMNF